MASTDSGIENQQKVQMNEANSDCAACKMIGGFGLIAASAYVLTRGIQARLKSSKIISVAFASSLGYSGVARLLNLYPFSERTEDKQLNQAAN